jgi:3-deoxy-D-manno-octulosonic-acid transferase
LSRKPQGKRVLFVRHAAFGDVLLTTPFVERLKAEDPDLEVDLFSTVGDVWDSSVEGGRWYSMHRYRL